MNLIAIRLWTLGHNLAVVGALHRAFILGIYLADGYGPDGGEGQVWRPNVEGKSALAADTKETP